MMAQNFLSVQSTIVIILAIYSNVERQSSNPVLLVELLMFGVEPELM